MLLYFHQQKWLLDTFPVRHKLAYIFENNGGIGILGIPKVETVIGTSITIRI